MKARTSAMPWPGTTVESAGVDSRELVLRHLRGEQNLGMAVAAAAGASLLGAGIWAGITVATEYQIGWMAIGIGLLVGLAVRYAGKGIDPVFAVAGAVFSLLGCVLGNLLAGCAFVAAQEAVSFVDVVLSLNVPLASAIMQAMFSPMDVLFYGLALYEGYRLSLRPIEAELPQEA